MISRLRVLSAFERTLLALSCSSLFFVLGSALFDLQITTRWWRSGGLSDFALKSMAASSLILGFVIAIALACQFAKKTIHETAGDKTSTFPIPRFMMIGLIGLAATAFLISGLFAALKPAHLSQESDFINYHFFLTRQYWLSGNWNPIENHRWEFLHMIIQNGLSFFWVAFPLLNRLPQCLLALFLALKLWFILPAIRVRNGFSAGLLAIVVFFGFRGVAIQLGIAMLDLVNAYFFVSIALVLAVLVTTPEALDEKRDWLWSGLLGVDTAAYLGHKSFGILLFIATLASIAMAHRVFVKRPMTPFLRRIRWGWFLAPVALFWLPTLYRDFYYTGDPFYPVLAPMTKWFCDDHHLTHSTCRSLGETASWLAETINNYGYGHGPLAYAKAFFMLPFASPGSVNNAFDYPLGLSWFAAWVVLLWGAFHKYRSQALLCGLPAATLFTLWFAGSQQARWLYPCLVFLSLFYGYFLTRAEVKETTARFIFLFGFAISLALNTARVVRSQKQTLRCMQAECLAINELYEKDFKTKCPDAKPLELQASSSQQRAYLACPVIIK